jgi:hypothetical protein
VEVNYADELHLGKGGYRILFFCAQDRHPPSWVRRDSRPTLKRVQSVDAFGNPWAFLVVDEENAGQQFHGVSVELKRN